MPVEIPGKRCKYGDPTCPCQDGDQCHYVAVAGTPAMMISPHLVDRLIDLHTRAMNDQLGRSYRVHAAERRATQIQIAALQAELRTAKARLAGVAAYADSLADGTRTTWPWRFQVRESLATILNEGP